LCRRSGAPGRRRPAEFMRALEGRARLAITTASGDKRAQASPSDNARQRDCLMSATERRVRLLAAEIRRAWNSDIPRQVLRCRRETGCQGASLALLTVSGWRHSFLPATHLVSRSVGEARSPLWINTPMSNSHLPPCRSPGHAARPLQASARPGRLAANFHSLASHAGKTNAPSCTMKGPPPLPRMYLPRITATDLGP
jgi:hypothetical protein